MSFFGPRFLVFCIMCNFFRLNVLSGCTTELNHKGQQFFTALFERFDKDKDGALSPFEQECLFSMCPAPPWGSDIHHIVPTNHQVWCLLSTWFIIAVSNNKLITYYWSIENEHIYKYFEVSIISIISVLIDETVEKLHIKQ